MSSTTPAPGEIPCPDPSAHDHSKTTHDSAAKAAMLASQKSANDQNFTADGKLSSHGAAQSIKYAKAQDLPSFPSKGATPNAAQAAATLAKDHQMKELWHPEASAAGQKAAAQAQKTGPHLDLWEPQASAAGSSAAIQAMRMKGLSPEIDRGYTDAGKSNSLRAATMSTGRQRAGSTPVAGPELYPDQANSGKNALNAAVSSSKMAPDGWNSEANQAARIKNLGGRMDPAMFGEHPPVEPELEEQRHQAALRASAVSMAKSMYDMQQRAVTPTDSSSVGAGVAHKRGQSSTSQADLKEEALKYITLQDAAQKIAHERLAKLDEEMAGNRFQQYYGYGDTSPKSSRYSMSRRSRALSSEEADLSDSDDERQARRIRNQMSQLNTASNTVDVKQRTADRASLMAAAEARVAARMHDLDEKVFQETGKVSQATMEQWEVKARQKAEAQRVERDAAAPAGKIHVGGGKFMDKAEVEAIAAARLKPTLDEIDVTAANMRARDAEIKRQQQATEIATMNEKARQQAEKAETKRIKDENKALLKKEKREREDAAIVEKINRKNAEKQRKADAKRAQEEEKEAQLAAARKARDERREAEAQEAAQKVEEKQQSQDVAREEPTEAVQGASLQEVGDRVRDEQFRPEADNSDSRDVVKDEAAPVAPGATLEEVGDRVRARQFSTQPEDQEAAVVASTGIAPLATDGRARDELYEDDEEEGHGHGAVAAVGTAGVAAVGGTSAAEALENRETGPASATIGPHDSNFANIVDPRVQPDKELQKSDASGAVQTPAAPTAEPIAAPDGPHRTALANFLDPHVDESETVPSHEQPTIGTPYPADAAVARTVDSETKPVDESHTARDVALPAGALVGATAAGAVATEEQKPRQVSKPVSEEPKEKPKGRGMFGRLKDKLAGREEEKRTSEASQTQATSSKQAEAAPVLAAPAMGESLTSSTRVNDAPEETTVLETSAIEPLRDVQQTPAINEPENDEDDIVPSPPPAVAPLAPAGSDPEEVEQVSPLSTDDEAEDDHLQPNAASDRPRRVELERHISTIESDSDGDSDALDESDYGDEEEEDEQRGRVGRATAVAVTPAEQPQQVDSRPTSTQVGAYEHSGRGGVTSDEELESKFATYGVNDPNPERTEEMKERIRKLEEEKAESGQEDLPPPKEKESLLHRVLHPFSHGDKSEAAAGATGVAATDRPSSTRGPADEDTTVVNEGTVNEPIYVARRSVDVESERRASIPTHAQEHGGIVNQGTEQVPIWVRKDAGEEDESKRRGLRGIFGKSSSKPSSKMTASGAESVRSDNSTIEGAGVSSERDGVVQPVTTTSTGLAEQEGRTDETVNDTQPVAREQGSDPSISYATETEGDYQDARDEFDESDVTPPATSGKNERETRFQEQL